MIYELFKTQGAARHYADELAAEIGGFVSDTMGTADDRTKWDYIDRDAPAFAGEVAAFRVIDADGAHVANYAFIEP